MLQKAGDERAQRIFKAHHRLLREAVESHGGLEVKWLGDGLMVAFDSAHDAVKCAIAMQQASRRPTAGERLQIRAGLNVGEAFVDESDYFGTSVVVARRLCDRADAGQIFAADIVTRLLDGRGADISTKDLGPLELKGITNPVPAVEIIYQHDPMALLRKLPFVGRQAEYETLLKKLAEAANGRGSVVLLAGEPGIGKTRLTEEFCEHASSSATVVRGNCYESDVAPPFGPWLEALRSLIDRLPEDNLREAISDDAPEIAVLLPELRRRLPDTAEALKLDPESERARLFDAIAIFLRNAADKKPLVIFLDDLHWCDKPSLLLLELVARDMGARRIVIVGAYRDVEVDRVHPLAQTLAALRRLEHHERLVIKGFTEDAVFDLLTAIEPAEATEAARRVLAGALFAEAEGNPFFIREVLNNLVESGKLFQRDGTWVSAATSIEELGIPEGIKEAIGRRMSRLSDGCNQMLGRASAFTSGFTWDELSAISDESEDELLDYLDEALGAQLIAERGEGRYAFTHALVRATLYGELSTPRRTRLHRRVAESLEALFADDIDAHLGELAAHYMASMGGEADKAIDYSIRAGKRAMELVAWEEAAAYFQQALEAMPESGDEERRCRVLLELGQALSNAGQHEPCAGTYRRAAESARRIGAAELLGYAATGFNWAAGAILGDTSLPAQRLKLLDEALTAVGTQDSAIRALLLSARAGAAHAMAAGNDPVRAAGWGAFLGTKDPAVVAQVHEAVSMAERLNDPLIFLRVSGVMFGLLGGPDRAAELLTLADKWIEAGRETGMRPMEWNGWGRRFESVLALGDLAAAHAAVDEEARLAGMRKGNAAGLQALIMRHRATLDMAEGRLGDAETAAFDAVRVGQEARDATTPIAFVGQLSVLRFYQGRAAEMESVWRGAVEQSPSVETFRAALALFLMQAGKPDESLQIFDALATAGFRNIPEDVQWMGTMTVLGELCAAIGRRDGMDELYQVMSRYPEGNATVGDTICYGPIARPLGMVATVLERWDDAERHFLSAIALSEREGMGPSLADARMRFADMLLRRNEAGDGEKARPLLEQALEAARDMGMPRLAADCERLLAEAG